MAEIQRSYYAIIPASVRYDEDLTPNAKLLYGEITALCNERGYCWASNAYFAELYKVSKSTVSRWIQQLSEKGYIESEMRYKEGSKEVESRILTIATPIRKNEYTPTQKCVEGIRKNEYTPPLKNAKDNNTVINNTFNNTNKDIDRQSSVSPLSDQNFINIKTAFEQVIRIATIQDCNYINEALEFYEPALILAAIDTGKDNARSFKYILSILDNWRKELGVKTYQDWILKIQQKGGYSGGSNSKRNEQRDNAEYDGLSL